MKKNTIMFLFALCPLVPGTARFAYALVLALALLWYFVAGIFFREVVRYLKPGDASPYIEFVCLAGSATAFMSVMQGLLPVLSVSLDLYVYLSAFSYLLLVSIDLFSGNTRSFLPMLPFIPIMLVFSAVREIISLGTISLPVPAGLLEITVIPGFSGGSPGFLGTAGGALVMLGILAWILKFLNRNNSVMEKNA